MRFFLFLSFFLTITIAARGQNINCDSMLRQIPDFQLDSDSVPHEKFVRYMQLFKYCGGFTDADSLLINGPNIATLMLKLLNEKKAFTYGDILDGLKQMRDSPDYKRIQQVVKLGEHRLDQSFWDNSAEIIKLLDIPEREFAAFRLYITANKLTGLSFKQGYVLYLGMENKNIKKEQPYDFREFTTYNEARSEAKRKGKNLLLFFTGYGVLCGSEMEKFFGNKEMKTLLDAKYLVYRLYTDEKKELPKQQVYISKFTHLRIHTVGQMLTELLNQTFKSECLPYFAIISQTGKIRTEKGCLNEDEFIRFLTKDNRKR